MKKKLNIDFKSLLILTLIAVIILMRACENTGEIKNGDVIKKNGKKYEVIGRGSDTIYITKDSVVFKKGKEIPVFIEVPKYIPINVDTQLILKDYFSKRFYIDTLNLGEKSFVIVKDTITENKILFRKYESTITEKIIKDSIFLRELPKRQLYVGIQGGFDKQDIINYGGVGLLYKDKKDKQFGLGVGINSKGQPSVMGGVFWKIKLKK